MINQKILIIIKFFWIDSILLEQKVHGQQLDGCVSHLVYPNYEIMNIEKRQEKYTIV